MLGKRLSKEGEGNEDMVEHRHSAEETRVVEESAEPEGS